MRQYSLVEHVGIGHHNMPRGTNSGAHRRRRIAVKGVGFYVLLKQVNYFLQLDHLVLGERLWWEKGRARGLKAPPAWTGSPAGYSRASSPMRGG